MRAFATLLGAFLFAALPLAASAQGSDFTDAAKRIEQDGTTVNVYVNGSEAEGYVATVAVSREGYVGAAMAVADIFSPLSVPEVSFVEMDKSNAVPEIFVTHWTGGAHCCVEATVFSETDDSWRALDVGAFDGDPESLAPQDIDGDGQGEIATYDNAFLYRFTSYAGSYAPPQIFGIRDGKITDVTGEPGFAAYLRNDLAEMEEMPDASEDAGSGSERNSWLAAYTAILLRLGEADPFARADSDYDTVSEWGLVSCADPAKEYDCPEDQKRLTPFPEALRSLLKENGYPEASQ